MKYIVNVALDVPLYRLFSYFCENYIPVGTRVLVTLGKKKVIGYVWETNVKQIDFDIKKIKPILEIFPETLNKNSIDLINFTSNYYHYPVGQTIFVAVPNEWRKPLSLKALPSIPEAECIITNKVQLNNEQQNIVDSTVKKLNKYFPILLYGITGSGKTEVYLAMIEEVLQIGLQVLIMVPEINLTPQLLERFKTRFPKTNMHIVTSNVSNKKRLLGYNGAASGEIQIIIGTRLSVFTPFKKLGLIIVDEEHDLSFKQQEGLRYHARDLAIWRANKLQIPIVLGSATPSLETLYNYKLKKYELFKLSNRAVSGAVLPDIRLIDLNLYKAVDGLTTIALNEIDKRITNQELSLVFINRRGYAPVISCYQCSWIGKCKNCSTNLVYHKNSGELKCHQCGTSGKVPSCCPMCNSQHLEIIGQGTQKIEEVLHSSFPNARIYRIDQDVLTTKTAWVDLYNKIKNHEIDILVGTQILAKGHDFPNLTLVIGLNIDNSLYSYDFRASELLYTQLTQVAGRAGRGSKKGLVLLQTSYPTHELYQYLQKHDFAGFVNYTLRERKLLNLPPFSYYAILRASGEELSSVLIYLDKINNFIKNFQNKQVILNNPVPSIMQRLKNRERAQMLISCPNRTDLHKFLSKLTELITITIKPPGGITWQLDVDPFEL